MYLLWRVYYSSPKRVTDLFGRVCICCSVCTWLCVQLAKKVHVTEWCLDISFDWLLENQNRLFF